MGKPKKAAAAVEPPDRLAAAKNGTKPKDKPADGPKIELNVDFSGVGLGKKNARLGFSTPYGAQTLSNANRMFRDSRCEVTISVDPNAGDDIEGQAKLPGAGEPAHTVKAVADIKGFRVSKDAISAGLTFSMEGVNLDELRHFASASGKLVAVRTGEAGDGDEEDEGGIINPDQKDLVDDLE